MTGGGKDAEFLLSHTTMKAMLLMLGMGWLLVPANLKAQTLSPLGALLPPKIHLGMTEKEVRETRPLVFDPKVSENFGDPQNRKLQLMEAAMDAGIRTVTSYYFKNHVLQGLMVSQTYAPAVLAKAAEAIRDEMAEGRLAQLADQKILKSDGEFIAELTATHWRGGVDGGLEIYAAASNRDVSVVLFDPRFFSVTDFFIDATRRAEVEWMVKGIKAREKRVTSAVAKNTEIVEIPFPRL